MSKARRIVPWFIDPVGMAIKTTTGFDYTPVGQIDKAINPRRPRRPEDSKKKVQPAPKRPSIVMKGAPAGPAPTEEETSFGRTPSGAGGTSDTTRGLLKPSAKRSLLSS